MQQTRLEERKAELAVKGISATEIVCLYHTRYTLERMDADRLDRTMLPAHIRKPSGSHL
jgi:hypothetical protein